MSTIPEGAVAQYAATDGQARRKRVTRQGGAAHSLKPAKVCAPIMFSHVLASSCKENSQQQGSRVMEQSHSWSAYERTARESARLRICLTRRAHDISAWRTSQLRLLFFVAGAWLFWLDHCLRLPISPAALREPQRHI